MESISIVVSCYKPHLEKLLRLLDSINNQTCIPYEVIVSTSSTKSSELPDFPEYKFSFQIISFENRRNAAENRNSAARLATGNYITFIDADDIMHPQRIEALQVAIAGGADFVMHNYMFKNNLNHEFPVYNKFDIEYNCLSPAPSGCVVQKNRKDVHHSMSTVRKDLFDRNPFNEGNSFERREDAVFCNSVLRLSVKNAYIDAKLGKYDEAGFWETV